jgi:DNA excision repair protein ERCC-4
MKILVDTREQQPLTFERFTGVTVERGALPTGDYSLPGFESSIACERKELNDLIACLQGVNRERFERELARGSRMSHFSVLVEGTLEDIGHGRYRSNMKPKAALQSIFAFMIRHRVPFLFCGSRRGAEYVCHSLLSKFLVEMERKNNASSQIIKDHLDGLQRRRCQLCAQRQTARGL